MNLATAGANVTLNAGAIVASGGGAVDFSTNSTAGGTATINFGSSGLAVALTAGGSGYGASLTNIPVTISAPNAAGGVQAIGHATSNASGLISGVYIDNWGSGYTANPTVTIGGGGNGARRRALLQQSRHGHHRRLRHLRRHGLGLPRLQRQHPALARRQLSRRRTIPASGQPTRTSSTDAAGPLSNMLLANLTIGSLRFTGAASGTSTMNIASGKTLTIGYNTNNVTQAGGILVTAAVGPQNITINGGSVQAAVFNAALFIHQNDPAGTLTIKLGDSEPRAIDIWSRTGREPWS